MGPTLPIHDIADSPAREGGSHPDSIQAPAGPLGDPYTVDDDRTRRARAHCDYLDRMVAEEVVPRSVAETARSVWKQASVATDDLIFIPSATAADGGPILYTWDRGDHHLEAEIPDSGPVEWFYQNRKTGEVWSADIPVTDPFPPALCTRLFRLALTGLLGNALVFWGIALDLGGQRPPTLSPQPQGVALG